MAPNSDGLPADAAAARAVRSIINSSRLADAKSRRRSSPLNQGNLRRRVLQPAAEEACLWSGFGFHAFRHTCASLLFAEGRNVKQVQRWLGHHSAAFTLATYVHLLPDEVAAPLEIEMKSSVHSGFDADFDQVGNASLVGIER